MPWARLYAPNCTVYVLDYQRRENDPHKLMQCFTTKYIHILSLDLQTTLTIWDAHSGATVGKPITGHSGLVYSVSYSPDGRYIVSSSDDKTIRM